MNPFFRIVIFLIFAFLAPSYYAQQKEMFKQKKERKRLWRRWSSDKDAYNPYLKKKAKDKPSARIAKGNKREDRQQVRRAKRQKRRSQRTIQRHSKIR